MRYLLCKYRKQLVRAFGSTNEYRMSMWKYGIITLSLFGHVSRQRDHLGRAYLRTYV